MINEVNTKGYIFA